jgi:hypothetical protein
MALGHVWSSIMKFKFTCELCKKQVKRGRKFNLDVFEKDDEVTATGHECADAICKSCINKLTKKINSLRK